MKSSTIAADRPGRLDKPPGAQPLRVNVDYSLSLVAIHLLAALAFLPWFFSWTGVVLAIAGIYVFGLFGTTIGYHRLLAHRSFTCPKWLEYTFAVIGLCAYQDRPVRWVAVHRIHHQHADQREDPHSPLAGVFWSHFGWLFHRNRDFDSVLAYEKAARDLLQDPFYMRLERGYFWLWIYVAHASLYVLGGWAFVLLSGGTIAAAVQFGSSLLVWGVFARTVASLHIAFSVNSVSHLWGYRNYETADSSRNNWLLAFLTHGEGWHNNHHAHRRCAAAGHRWWEFDLTYSTIRLMEMVGLAKNVIKPESIAKIADRRQTYRLRGQSGARQLDRAFGAPVTTIANVVRTNPQR
jgi:fatty-acid desaturase